MSVQRLKVDDVVLFHQNNDKSLQTLGSVRYIGLIYGYDVMTQYVGIELLEPISNGHNGTINGYSYFNTEKGYGTHCTLRNVIKTLKTSELFLLCKNKLQNINSSSKSNTNNNNKTNDMNTPQSTEFDQRDSILTDFDGFAPKTPFSPRNSLLSQRKSIAQTKAIRMLKPRQSLSAALEFPDTEPIAAVIAVIISESDRKQNEQHSSEKERSKKRRKKTKKHIKKHTKKKHKHKQPKIDRRNRNLDEIPRPKPTLTTHSKPRLATHSKSTLTTHSKPVLGTHSKSTSEIAHNNIKQKKHKHKRRNNHNNINRKPVLGTHSKSASDTAHNNMKQFTIVQPEHIQNHLYLPQIPYSHSGSHSQQFEPIENHLYVPQMQYSHSSSHSVPNLEEINMQLQPHNHSYGLTQHNLIILALRLNPITDGLHGVNGSPISNPTPTPADTYLTPSNPTPDSHTATPNDAQQPSADAIFLDPTNDPTTDPTLILHQHLLIFQLQ